MDHTASASLGSAGDANSRDHPLEAKHKVFLSHSGAQKSFVADVCADLMRRDRHPFFDKLRSSLPVGEKFPHLIFDAIRQCKVGVVVLSEEFFTRTKWPMLELAAMVEESRKPDRRIKIIPVFYSISRDRCRDAGVQLEWMREHWKKWEEEDKGRVDLKKWHDALGIFGSTTGLEMKGGMLDGELRAEIVEAVCKEVPQESGWDDSSVEGKSRLFEEMYERIYKGAQPMDLKGGVYVVGLYGMGGVGKTTACKILCKELSGEYHDKVCHVEFGSAREEELLRKVLRKLSELEVERLENVNVDECHGYLKTHLREGRVFLALDNVSDESDKQAEFLLEANFGNGSIVLVTARSMDQLQRVGVKEENCFGMPELELEEAKSLFLNCAHLKENEVGEEFVKTCLRRCYFSMSSGRKHYHPLALKVLGREVGAMIRGGRDEREVLSRIGDFKMSRRKELPVFSILRSSFDSMLDEDQLLFLCIALDIERIYGLSICTAMEWLCMVLGKERGKVEDMLESLKRRSLLDSFGEDEDGDEDTRILIHDLWREFALEEMRVGRRVGSDPRPGSKRSTPFWKRSSNLGANRYGRWRFHMHDLWREFAKEEMRVGKFEDGRRVYVDEVWGGRVDLREHLKLAAVNLSFYRDNGVAVDVGGLKYLRSLVIEFCWSDVTMEVSGLGSLERLTYLALYGTVSYECIAEVGLLLNLQVIDFRNFGVERLPDMSKLTSLRTLWLEHSKSLVCINLQNLPSLSVLYLQECDALRSVDVSGCRLLKSFYIDDSGLEELNISSCPLIASFDYAYPLSTLRKLNITGCSSIQKLDRLKYMRSLVELRARDCERLAILPECTLPYLRVLDIESAKVPTGLATLGDGM